MKIAITGSRGLIGSSLVPHLRSQGHDVIRVVRSHPAGDEALWDPANGTIEAEKLHGVEAAVHLAGAGVGDRRWSPHYKKVILSSRVAGTSTLAQAMARLPVAPSVMLSGSAVGFYGLRGQEVLTEEATKGEGFLSDVCAQWESSTRSAAEAGIRVVNLRTGVVLSGAGGALKKQLPLFRLGLGAQLGSGDQQLSWITRRDVVAAISFLLAEKSLAGPFNLVAPDPVSNATFTKELGRVLHRPARLVVPEAVLRIGLGNEMASEVLLASQRAVPQRLLSSGFVFRDEAIGGALVTALEDR